MSWTLKPDPVPAGNVQVSCVCVATGFVHVLDPTVTDRSDCTAALKLVPKSVSVEPPTAGAVVGERLVSVGGK